MNPRSRTPKHLAEKILTSRSALEGERKQVTVLFADVKGSMDLGEKVDPEEWYRIMDRFFQILSDGVHRFEGTVDKFTGDGIMAIFGAPIAHEDHARRACYAALHLKDELRRYAEELKRTREISFAVRMGLNSGEVVVGTIGDDLRMVYTAHGNTVGLGQRMEQLAEPGSAYVTGQTEKLVSGFFRLRDLGSFELKGVSTPVRVYELEGATALHTPIEVSRSRGFSRFVGRTDEMAALEAALERSLEGTGRVGAVVGEAGVGKSRLCAEFVERCRARGLAVYEAHCPAHGKTIPYLPLLELLRNLFGITEQDALHEARRKIAGDQALLDDAFADDRELVFDFLGVADPETPALQLDPTVRQRRLFTFLRRLIQLRTESEPIVLLIDDLHWIDPGSDQFLEQIVEAVSTTRTLLLVNFRPEYAADWARRSWVLQLPMAPLGSEALTELVRDWVGSSQSVAALPALVEARSGGNPFFAEEIVLSLIETGHLAGTRGAYELATAIDAVEVPATVQSLLAARIDRLGEPEKKVLCTAAVIGKEFPRPLLEAVVDNRGDDLEAALTALRTAELVHERAIYPVAEHAFKHPLTHEVAYASLLRAQRERIHARVAEALAASAGAKADELAPLIAHHWDAAGNAEQAVRWHERAALWCMMRDAAGALRHSLRVSDLVDQLDLGGEELVLKVRSLARSIALRWRLGGTLEDIRQDFERASAVASQVDDPQASATLYGSYAAAVGLVDGNAADYMRYTAEGVRYAETAGDQELAYVLGCLSAASAAEAGEWRSVITHSRKHPYLEAYTNIAGMQYMGGGSPRLIYLYAESFALWNMGRYQEAERLWNRSEPDSSVERFQEIGGYGWYTKCVALVLYGRVQEAMRVARELAAKLKYFDTPLGRGQVAYAAGVVYKALDELDAAHEAFMTGVRIFDQLHADGWNYGPILGHLAELCLLKGELDEARRWGDKALAFCCPRNLKNDLAPWVSMARIHMALGEDIVAKERIAQIQSIVDSTGGRIYQPRLYELRAEYARIFGVHWKSDDELRKARQLYAELGAVGHADRIAGQMEGRV